MPFKRPLEALGEEIHFDSGDYHALLDKLLDHVEWDEAQRRARARAAPTARWSASGLRCSSRRRASAPPTACASRSTPPATVEVITGGASIGQGFETVMAQVAAEALGADYKKMRVIHGQTDRIEHGIGAHASRATVMTASATRVAALKVRDKALDIAAELMQAPADALDIVNGEVVRRRPRRRAVDRRSARSRRRSCRRSKLRGGREPGLSAEGWFYADHQVYPYGNHLAVVKVDPDTGGVKVRALRHRLRHRPRHQSDAGQGPDRRRLRAGARRRADGGVHLQRARRSARRRPSPII